MCFEKYKLSYLIYFLGLLVAVYTLTSPTGYEKAINISTENYVLHADCEYKTNTGTIFDLTCDMQLNGWFILQQLFASVFYYAPFYIIITESYKKKNPEGAGEK